MSGSGWEAHCYVQEWSEGPPLSPRVVGRPSRKSGCDRDTLPDVRVWSKGPPGCPLLVGMPSRMSVSGWDTLPEVREWSGGPPG